MAKLSVKVLPSDLRMPAEWETHEITWLAWPHNLDQWSELEIIEDLFGCIVRELARGERVHILVQDSASEERVAKRLAVSGAYLSNVSFFEIKTRDIWIRDYGPVFVSRKADDRVSLAAVRWSFNAWGGKYEDLVGDGGVSDDICRSLGVKAFEPGIVMEGGSIDVNGRGTCLTTESCLLNPNRNGSLGPSNLESYLRDYLGVRKIIWLPNGIAGDDTDGHVDQLARFVNADTVVAAWEEDSKDENFSGLKKNFKRLQDAVDADGKKLRIVPLPMPGKIIDEGQRLPASYANFYIANGVVLVPIFNQPNDEKAISILRELFSSRRVVGYPCLDLIKGQGALHCVTQQQPSIHFKSC